VTFLQFDPAKTLSHFIECYWLVDNDDAYPSVQKIIPDGFTEIIVHYRDPYEELVNGKWQLQSRQLLAGQIKKHFYLRNTGRSGVLGIKFKPAALAHLLGIHMKSFTGKVVPLSDVNSPFIPAVQAVLAGVSGADFDIRKLDTFFEELVAKVNARPNKVDEAVKLIVKSNGTITVAELCQNVFTSERLLQMLFQQYIGLSPKFYSRIVRFNYVFELLKQGNPTWCDVTYHSGFYDQSHFIRNFKSFTGEDPSDYGFDTPNMANFFLKMDKFREHQ
jgi:AraC-like DNA-binding protein